jgi:predicted patatin/cPLA2 family phospholipase
MKRLYFSLIMLMMTITVLAGPNLTNTAVVMASSVTKTDSLQHIPAKANDGSYSTCWTTDSLGAGEWLLLSWSAPQRLNDIIMASSALPYVSSIVEVDGVPMLDGGIVDSIPVQHSIERGHGFNVIIATRNLGFRSQERDIKMPPVMYDDYPRLRVALSHRVEAYNEQLEMIERMERWGEVAVIRPERKIEVGRVEKDIDKLERLYEEGFMLGERFCKEWS